MTVGLNQVLFHFEIPDFQLIQLRAYIVLILTQNMSHCYTWQRSLFLIF